MSNNNDLVPHSTNFIFRATFFATTKTLKFFSKVLDLNEAGTLDRIGSTELIKTGRLNHFYHIVIN